MRTLTLVDVDQTLCILPISLLRQLRCRYVLSVYWAIQTVTTVGYGDVGPVNTGTSLTPDDSKDR